MSVGQEGRSPRAGSPTRAALAGLTVRGRSLLGSGVALAALSVLLGQRDLLRAALLLLALPLAAALLVSRARYLLTCQRSVRPGRVTVGGSAEVTLTLHNDSRLPTGVLLMTEALPASLGASPRFVLDRVEPQRGREVSYRVTGQQRGPVRVGPLSVQLGDPFGLCELTRSFASSERLVVTPPVTTLPPVRLGGTWVGGSDATARGNASAGTDDVTVRGYRHGDDLRKVHWRTTARTGELMVRREEQPDQSRTALLLDTRPGAHTGRGAASSLEWAIAAAASVGVALLRSGSTLAATATTGEPLTAALGAAGGVTGAEAEGALLDALASLPAASGARGPQAPARGRRSRPTRSPEVLGALARLGVGAAAGTAGTAEHPAGVLVAVLGALGPDDVEALRRAARPGTTCVAVLLDTDSWAPGTPAARRAAVDEHAAHARALSTAGWRVLPVVHGQSLAEVWPLAGNRPARRPAGVGA